MTNDNFTLPDDTDEPEINPNITVMEVRGEKEIGFLGMKHLELDEAKKDQIHNVYADIIIELDDIKDKFTGADRAWHIGRILDEYNVAENSNMTLKDLGAFNTIETMHARRLIYARNIYEFWPDKKYDPRHSVTALGELVSRSRTNGTTNKTRNGYNRLLDKNEELTKTDVLMWDTLETNDLETIIEIVTDQYKQPNTIAAAVKRLWLLTDHALTDVENETVEELIHDKLTD